jgi:hypothetical protein
VAFGPLFATVIVKVTALLFWSGDGAADRLTARSAMPLTVTVYVALALWGVGLPLSVAVTVKVNAPEEVGVPLRLPVAGSRVSPAGGLPLVTAQWDGVTPPVVWMVVAG